MLAMEAVLRAYWSHYWTNASLFCPHGSCSWCRRESCMVILLPQQVTCHWALTRCFTSLWVPSVRLMC